MDNLCEKVIRGLECCKMPFSQCYDGGCPYYVNEGCKARLKADALELLKEQQEKDELQKEEMAGVDAAFDKIIADARDLLKKTTPRVMTPEYFDNNPMVDENGKLPAWIEYKRYNGVMRSADGWGIINQIWVDGYRDRRFWTARPTEEQREATPWEQPKEGEP